MYGSPWQEVKSEWEVPRVSPYRLAAHLTSAAIIYGTLLWTCLTLAFPTSLAAAVPAGSALSAGAAALRRWAHPVAGLIAITALSGVCCVSCECDLLRHACVRNNKLDVCQICCPYILPHCSSLRNNIEEAFSILEGS